MGCMRLNVYKNDYIVLSSMHNLNNNNEKDDQYIYYIV